MVTEFLAFNTTHLEGRMSREEYERAVAMEEKINAYQKRYKKAKMQ